MEAYFFECDHVPQFSSRDKAYIREDERLRPFYKYPVTLKAFSDVIRDKSQENTDRATLVRVLQEQYEELDTTEEVRRNIESLASDTTFTVVTAHQPALFTGPLYYIYKIISCLKVVQQLRESYPEHEFVPVFVSGSEDHDFKEINHAHLFGKTIEWEQDKGGSVGFLETQSLGHALSELKEILGDSDKASQVYQLIEEAYTRHDRYAAATRHLVNSLFKTYGLVILDMSAAPLKRLFVPVMKEELLDSPSQDFVEKATRKLEEAGFSGQAYPREINLFYLGDGFRARIVRQADQWEVLDRNIRWNQSELIEELEAHPERFSPNVVLRPIYQELVLPNLAYVGGGGEIAYWLERKEQFAHFGINFPMLIRRDSVLWVDKGTSRKMEKVGFHMEDLFKDTDELIKAYVNQHTQNEISLKEEQQDIDQIFEQVVEKASQIDPTLVKTTKAEAQKTINSLKGLEAKLIRAEKNNHDTAINQIRGVKERLFPENGLQERYDNFLALYLRYGDQFLETLMEHQDPFRKKMCVILDR